MSNKKNKTKRHKVKKETEKIFSTNVQKKRLMFNVSFVVLVLLFVFVWGHIFVTTHRFNEQLENMVQGKDYFIEDVIITKKKAETYSSSSLSTTTNYYLYYGHDGKRMNVNSDTYEKYGVGSIIPAYTTDHIHYGLDKNTILPENQFRNNEIMKGVGIFLGLCICCLALYG